MPNYLVRVRDTREAVGIFAVDDLDDLLFWIDEVTDPADCEYAEIGSGSIIWEGRAKAVPLKLEEVPEDHDPTPLLDSIGPHRMGGAWFNWLVRDDLEFTPCAEDVAANDR